jgi:hypothetical protein
MSKTLIKDQNAQSLPLFVLGNDPIIVDGSTASASSGVISTTDFTIVQLYASNDCTIKVSENPTATASSMAIPGGQILYYVVRPGHKIAVLGAKLQITVHNG